MPVTPRAAATVVLLRDGGSGLEGYLLRRVRTMAFAGGMYVFPGGTVDPRDSALSDGHWAGAPPDQWARILSADSDLTRALVCAAVRETFEESGVLLAGPTANDVVEDTRGANWEADRAALVDRTLSFADFLERRELVLRADLLRPWAHWITPEIETKRYDTRFFVAALPTGQRTRDVGGEADHAQWLAPATAVARHLEGDLGMLPPTVVTLRELSSYDRVADVLAAGSDRDVRPRLPQVVVDADTARLLLPHADDGT